MGFNVNLALGSLYDCTAKREFILFYKGPETAININGCLNQALQLLGHPLPVWPFHVQELHFLSRQVGHK